MVAKKGENAGALSILEAVEALETIADLDLTRDVDVANEQEIQLQNQQVASKTHKWLGKKDSKDAVKLVQETFHVVLNYLKGVYAHDSSHLNHERIVEGVKTIMVLVGDAAQKLDRFTTIFKETKYKSVKALKEYKQLQEFYLTRIAKKIDEGVLSKWILELATGSLSKTGENSFSAQPLSMTANYVFIDMESVKKDTEYELFFLRKEDGSRFYNPRLIRNIKLVCDFGETIHSQRISDPLIEVKQWEDKVLQQAAKQILRSVGSGIDHYFHEVKQTKKRELVECLNKAIFALLMSANPRNLLENSPPKICSEYFKDFHRFLRDALQTREYQRSVLYSSSKKAKKFPVIPKTVQLLCRGLYSSIQGSTELSHEFRKLLQDAQKWQSSEHEKAARDSGMLWSTLASHQAALKKYIKQYPGGPLEKVLNVLEDSAYQTFDPIGQLNIPSQNYTLFLENHKMTNLRLPSPTVQEFIQKAVICDEFKGFLWSYRSAAFERKHLLVNLQDKTSWKEHARSCAIEEIEGLDSFSKLIDVVTLPKDTDFYHQFAPYQNDHKTELFFEHFKEHLQEENCGFYFPKKIKDHLFPGFIEGILDGVHRVFFGGMNVLTVKNRREFIEIFYLFLTLKLLDMTRPDTFSFTCKDAIDTGCVFSAQFFAFLLILSKHPYTEIDLERLECNLHLPAILLRKRMVMSERFERMITAIRRLETTREELGTALFHEAISVHFGKFYDLSVWKEVHWG